MKKTIVQFLTLAFMSGCFVWSSWGSTLDTQKSTLYPFNNMIALQDDFLSGTTSTGNVGSLGWSFSGGTVTVVNGMANRYGIIERSTGAVINTVAPILLSSNSTAIDPSVNLYILHVLAVGTNDSNTTIRIGAGNSLFASPVVHGIYFEKLDGDTNWFCVTRASSVETRVDSGVSIDTSFHNFRIDRRSTGVEWRIDNVRVCASHPQTNIPAVFINPGSHIVNSAASSKTYQLDYFEMRITGFFRP